jgi:hypothetical protein
MLVALPTHSGDIADLARLLDWIKRLGDCKQHSALIIADAGTAFDQVMNVREQAGQIFRDARVITNERPVKGWPDGANSLFKAAAAFIHEHVHQSFLWLEPDCVVMCPGWLDDLERSYSLRIRHFMGMKYKCQQPFQPETLMSGVAMYPADAIQRLPALPQSPRAWDVDGAEVMVRDGEHTERIFHIWGQQNLPPTFVAQKTQHSPINAMTLEDIPREAVIFHREKSGSLIRLLERKLFPEQFKERIAVCFNVHAGDISLALLHSQWLRTMAKGKKWNHRAIICHDPSAPVVSLNHFEQNLRYCFTEVESFVYSRPPIPQYPASANFAFQSVALHMARQKSPWLWFEADAIALKPDWLEQLQAEYDKCGRSWFGSVVPHMNHLQGTAIYPADAATRMPGAMNCGHGQAFDMLMKDDVMQDCHDASRLMFHVWSLVGRMAHPVGGGEVPANITAAEVAQWLPRSAVFCHRVKDQSLVQLLLRREYQH